MTFNGPCLFLTCLETGPHVHASCAECGVLRHANFFHCPTCSVVTNAERAVEGLDPIPLFGGAE